MVDGNVGGIPGRAGRVELRVNHDKKVYILSYLLVLFVKSQGILFLHCQQVQTAEQTSVASESSSVKHMCSGCTVGYAPKWMFRDT
jgi:hypothetical protein